MPATDVTALQATNSPRLLLKKRTFLSKFSQWRKGCGVKNLFREFQVRKCCLNNWLKRSIVHKQSCSVGNDNIYRPWVHAMCWNEPDESDSWLQSNSHPHRHSERATCKQHCKPMSSLQANEFIANQWVHCKPMSSLQANEWCRNAQ